jgi:hypothetical protein
MQSARLITVFVNFKKWLNQKEKFLEKRKQLRINQKLAKWLCLCLYLITVELGLFFFGIEFLPHLCESHELSSSVNTSSVCCWALPAIIDGFFFWLITVQRIVKSKLVFTVICIVGHCNALHEISIDNLTVGRGKESRRVNVTSNQVIHICNRFLLDRYYVIGTGCVCAI